MMSQQNLDEVGSEIEGWIRHLVEKAKFDYPRMKGLAHNGTLSEIRQLAQQIVDRSVVGATDVDETMAPIMIDAIDTQVAVFAEAQKKIQQARVNNMTDRSSYLDRDTLNNKAS